jgi:uncharacterized membrane protein
MTWTQLAKAYGLTFLVFLVVDFFWLGVIAKRFYQRQLGHLFAENVNWGAAFLFYLIFVLGLMVFVIYPAFKSGGLAQALWMGAVFGLVTYATFDLTNLALIKGWPAGIVAVDIGWGIVLSGIVSTAGYGIARWLA